MANGGGAFSAVEIIDLLITAALMPMFLFMPVPAPLGQWRRVLTCQAPAADPALELVRRALEQQATPHDNPGLRTLAAPPAACRQTGGSPEVRHRFSRPGEEMGYHAQSLPPV